MDITFSQKTRILMDVADSMTDEAAKPATAERFPPEENSFCRTFLNSFEESKCMNYSGFLEAAFRGFAL